MTRSKRSRKKREEQREARKRAEERREQYSEKEREHALKLVVSGMARGDVAKAIGCCTESVRLWYNKAEAEGTLPVVEGAARAVAVAREAEVDDDDDEDRAEGAGAGQAVESAAIVPVSTTASARSVYTPRDPGQGLAEYGVRIPLNPIADSGACRSPIPAHADHRRRGCPAMPCRSGATTSFARARIVGSTLGVNLAPS